MPVSADYVARETAANLWRNRLMTIAAILTVAVSLALVGAALLLRQGAANAEVDWQRGTQVTVWMKPAASSSETRAVGQELSQFPYVKGCSFHNKAADYHEAQQLLTPAEFSVLTVPDMPTSYRCTPVQPSDALVVENHFNGQPGVKNVTAPNQQIHAMEETIDWLQVGFIVVAVVLLLSAAVLILNTIRMAIFARRREVSVMKLVGATNAFIRVPFMSEGLIQGLVGSLLAAAAVFGLHEILNYFGNPNTDPSSVLTQMRMTGWSVFWTDTVVVMIGVLIGSVGSAVAIRRFLDV